MLTAMADIIISDDNEPEGEVLAEAAVASAAMAGAAHAQASAAAEDAEEAEQAAAVAQGTADAAIIEVHDRPTYDDTSEMIDRRLEEFGSKLVAMLELHMAPKTEVEEVTVEEVPEEVKPKSVEKKERRKKKTWAERYLGMGDDD